MSAISYLGFIPRISEAAAQLRNLTEAVSRAFGVPIEFLWHTPERPVDRARRLRVERTLRAYDRRARRKGRSPR